MAKVGPYKEDPVETAKQNLNRPIGQIEATDIIDIEEEDETEEEETESPESPSVINSPLIMNDEETDGGLRSPRSRDLPP